MNPRRIALWSVALAALALTGCPPVCPEKHVSLEALAAEYNANAAKVPRLWARVRLQVNLTDDSGRSVSWGSASPLAKGNGRLFLEKDPARGLNFLIVCEEIGTELARLGTDADAGLYYFWYHFGHSGKAWLGRTVFAGAPKVKSIPIDPTQLPEILGVTALPPVVANQMPAVVMTLQCDPCAYVVRYLRPQPVTGLLKIWREVYFRWDDNRPRRPFHVRLYDPDGLCRVLADVADYRPIATGGPPASWPIMPTDIRVTWPAIRNVQTASSLHMTLREMTTESGFRRSVFDFWRALPEIEQMVAVDAAYGPMGVRERPEP